MSKNDVRTLKQAIKVARRMQLLGYSWFNAFSAVYGFRYGLRQSSRAERQAFSEQLRIVLSEDARFSDKPRKAAQAKSRPHASAAFVQGGDVRLIY